MTNKIHPTAIIADFAVIGNNVQIGPYSIIGANVKIADHTVIHPHVVIDGHTDIGEHCLIYSFASIGLPPQDLKYRGEPSKLIIGKNNVIREQVTMNPGTESGAMETVVGDGGLFMIGAHVAHDCVVGNNVILANNATIAGHVQVGDYVVIGGLSAVHQFVRIGSYAIIGGMSGVDTDVIPFGRVKGERASLAGLNLVGLERRGFSKDQVKTLQRAFKELFAHDGTMEKRLDGVEESYTDDEAVSEIVKFAREKSRFPLCQPVQKKRQS